MSYRGHVSNGVVVLEEGAELPEGTEVRVEPVEAKGRKTLYERFKNTVGTAEGLPSDLAEQHDHYIHAAPVAPHPDLQAAERLYLQDLPDLLRSKPGRWVAYTAQGAIAEGDDELTLFQSCYRRGLRRGQFLVARVEPDLPVAEIDENWFPADR